MSYLVLVSAAGRARPSHSRPRDARWHLFFFGRCWTQMTMAHVDYNCSGWWSRDGGTFRWGPASYWGPASRSAVRASRGFSWVWKESQERVMDRQKNWSRSVVVGRVVRVILHGLWVPGSLVGCWGRVLSTFPWDPKRNPSWSGLLNWSYELTAEFCCNVCTCTD